MKITRSSDWRDQLPFETPVAAEGVLPGEAARCAICGVHSDPLPRSELWAVKHRHPHNPAGTVVMYCAEHTPRPAPVVAAAPARRAAAPRERREPQPRATPKVERVAAVCPNCFMEIPATGVCGMCGYEVA